MPPPPPQTDQWAGLSGPRAWLLSKGDQTSLWYSYYPLHYFHDYQHFLVGVPNNGWYLGDQNQPLRSVYEGFQTYCAQPYSIPAAPWQMITLHSANACIHWDDEEGDPWD